MINSRKFIIVAAIVLFPLLCIYLESEIIFNNGPYIPKNAESVVSKIGEIKSLNNGKWIKSFRAANGDIYLNRHLISIDSGITAKRQNNIDVEVITSNAAGAVIATKNLFYAVDAEAFLIKPGVYKLTSWRSTDNLRTIHKEASLLYVQEGPIRKRNKGEFYGIGVYRDIIVMPDGSWLMSMYGNFAPDQLPPQDRDAQLEESFMMRTFIVKSTDEGNSWNYLATVAAPKKGDPVGEGFVEPTIALLEDGRLLCIMRSGHHFPLYASWSSDNGKTWTRPVYTGLDRGCAPCLKKLNDGRLALGWGRRYSEGWSRVTTRGDQADFKYPGQGYTNLAISDDGGATWANTQVARRTGSCYSTIFEVEPNVIFFQVDQWIWRVSIKPKT